MIDRLVTQMVNGADDGDGAQRRRGRGRQGGRRRPGDRGRPAARPGAGRGGARRRTGRLRRDGPPAARRPRPAAQARRRGRPGTALHLLRELHRLAGGAARDRLRGQPAAPGASTSCCRCRRPTPARRRGRRRAGRTRGRTAGRGAGPSGDAAGAPRPAGRRAWRRRRWCTRPTRRSSTGCSPRSPTPTSTCAWAPRRTPDAVADLAPDAVVVATGGRVVYPDLPGADLPHVYGARPGRDLPRFAGTGHGSRSSVAPSPASRSPSTWRPQGRLVAVLEAGETVAPEVGWKRKSEHLIRLDRLGVTLHIEVDVEAILPDGRRVRPGGRHPPGPPGRHRRARGDGRGRPVAARRAHRAAPGPRGPDGRRLHRPGPDPEGGRGRRPGGRRPVTRATTSRGVA